MKNADLTLHCGRFREAESVLLTPQSGLLPFYSTYTVFYTVRVEENMRKVARKVVISMMIIQLLCGCGSFTGKSAHQNSEGVQGMNSLKDLLNELRRERDEKKATDILRKDPSLATQTWDGEDDILIKGSTALHYAAHYDYMDLVKLLVENGADVNASEAHWWTNTDIHCIFLYGCGFCVSLLIPWTASIQPMETCSSVHHAVCGESI